MKPVESCAAAAVPDCSPPRKKRPGSTTAVGRLKIWDRDEVNKEIFEQSENFKKHRNVMKG